MPHYIYRILSPESTDRLCGNENSWQFDLRWPFVWNAASEQSWSYAEKQEVDNPSKGYMERHMGRVSLHIGHIGIFSNSDIAGSIPSSAGVNDPFEGYIINPDTIGISDDKMSARAIRIIDNRWHSICFSHIECGVDEIEARIEAKIVETRGYEYERRDYIYGTFGSELFFGFMDACAELRSRIGGVAVKVHYWDRQGVVANDIGGIAHPPYVGFSGSYARADAIKSGSISNNEFTLSGDEVKEFLDDVKSIIPFKFKPAYGDEEEIRLSFFSFDGWDSDEISLAIDPKSSALNTGRYTGSFGGQ